VAAAPAYRKPAKLDDVQVAWVSDPSQPVQIGEPDAGEMLQIDIPLTEFIDADGQVVKIGFSPVFRVLAVSL
jgi:hypothetical protein